jgi:hypothetical protein
MTQPAAVRASDSTDTQPDTPRLSGLGLAGG